MGSGAHPYFNDQGAASWFTSLEEGLGAARAQKKNVVIAVARRGDAGSKALFETVLPDAAIKAALGGFVAVAGDFEKLEPKVQELLEENMIWASALPMVLYLDPQGKFLHGTSGAVTQAALAEDLQRLAKG